MNNLNKSALKVGAWFSLISFLSTMTFIVPYAYMMPCVFIENIIKFFNPNVNNKLLGLILITICIIALIILLKRYLGIIKKRLSNKIPIDNETLVINNLLISIIIHPLGFYLYWGFSSQFSMDGQLSFVIFTTYQVSSLFFVIFGFVIQEFVIDSEI